MFKVMLALMMAALAIGDGCAKQDHALAAGRTLRAPGPPPKVLAVYMPWFGDTSHMNVGYSSHDSKVVVRQIKEAQSRGIAGFLVDWNGPERAFTDRSFAVMQKAARKQHFEVALLYNEAEDANGEATDDAIAAFDKAYEAYIGPKAPDHGAYLTLDGRPVIFIFPKQGHADWNRVRQHLNQWPTPPILFYKDEPPAEYADAFDGLYPWIHPGNGGWSSDGSDWGKQYLENFYSNMAGKYSNKLMAGAAWPGFDDSKASWGLNRHMNPRCGQTLQDTLQLFHSTQSDSVSIPYLLVETWNDHEEGTAIESTLSQPCEGQVQAGQIK